MSLETLLRAALLPVCPLVYDADSVPDVVAKPYVTHSQIGGASVNYVADTVPDKRNARMQINVWATTRTSANDLALQIEAALIQAPTIQARPLGAFSATSDFVTKLKGTRQDFSIWAPR